MAKRQSGYRVVLQLDHRVALEAIILNRLQRLPANRRQEWLRGLLVQGFRQECQALRVMTDSSGQVTGMTFSPRFRSGQKTAAANPMVPTEPLPSMSRVDKPFAALGKVIG